jgi:hypothetical protein
MLYDSTGFAKNPNEWYPDDKQWLDHPELWLMRPYNPTIYNYRERDRPPSIGDYRVINRLYCDTAPRKEASRNMPVFEKEAPEQDMASSDPQSMELGVIPGPDPGLNVPNPGEEVVGNEGTNPSVESVVKPSDVVPRQVSSTGDQNGESETPKPVEPSYNLVINYTPGSNQRNYTESAQDIETTTGRNLVELQSGTSPKKWYQTCVIGQYSYICIPYVIDSKITDDFLALIKKGIAEFQRYQSCIRLVPYTNQNDYVSIQISDTCYSDRGFKGGVHNIFLSESCAGGVVVYHHLMHVIGFPEMHRHPDRDRYIYIDYRNYQKSINGWRSQIAEFDRETYGKLRPDSQWGDADYYKTILDWDWSSVMLFGSIEYQREDIASLSQEERQKPNNWVIHRLDNKILYGPETRMYPTQKDVEAIRNYYCVPLYNKG